MSEENHLSEIESLVSMNESDQIIDKEFILKCMASQDVEVLGAVFALIHKEYFYRRINPSLTFDDYHCFNLKYYRRCLIENPKGEWASSRYEAGWSLAAWFKELFKDASVPKTALNDLKCLIEKLYLAGDEKLRNALITGVLEHIFLEREARLFFSDWKNNMILKDVYKEALEYADQLLATKSK